MAQLQGRRPTVAQKYGYLYDSTELTALVGRTRELEGRARRVYFALNNNVGDAPAINGIQIRELLGQEVADRETVAAEWRARRGRGAPGRPRPDDRLSGLPGGPECPSTSTSVTGVAGGSACSSGRSRRRPRRAAPGAGAES